MIKKEANGPEHLRARRVDRPPCHAIATPSRHSIAGNRYAPPRRAAAELGRAWR